ncbi:MAG: TrpB-like pyridoxal phosphate-dependent enzyme [Methylacidiphilales bacterium]|nr:TrpB-like pyridoxal phosphate-dependent enzyme [Candidatus Methylacidiphilales bacterium]
MKKIYLAENDLPRSWYNILADLENKPLPPLHPVSKLPIGPADLSPIFPMELIKQEVSSEPFIEIPDEVVNKYLIWRPSPLIRATEFEKALGGSVSIYYKYEGTSPAGSHKPNTALAQAYYNKKEGVKKLTTETGAGQWGTALSFACQQFGLACEVYMVKISFDQKPYRKILMNSFGAKVIASPSRDTQAGKKQLELNPQSNGSLGIAISEAIEMAAQDEHTKYSLGSVLNHVLMHQTIIGQEAKKQLEIVGEYPDIIIAPLGGGSNFAGICFPFLRDVIKRNKKTRCIAVEPASCPKLTKGKFLYDFGDTAGYTPLLPMYTLGHNFNPAAIHAGGLRYHGASVIISQLLKDKLIEASAIQQLECFKAGLLFSQTEGILPAPEASHAIAQVIREAKQAQLEGKKKTILFNLCGHGYLDLQAYQDFFENKLTDHELSEADLVNTIKELEQLQPKTIGV